MPGWDDLFVTPLATWWQKLRALRYGPPGLAEGDAERSALFCAALEQSEQFFRAAGTTDAVTRPLLLFYGLSQSGRALRAVADPELWNQKTAAHGITVRNLASANGLSMTVVADKGNGLFGAVARTLGRATLGDGQTVGDLARLGRLGPGFQLPGRDPDFPPLQLRLVSQGLFYEPGPLRAELNVPGDTWARRLPDVRVRTTADYDAYRAHVRSQLQHYPTLSEASLVEIPGYFDLDVLGGGERSVQLEWPDRAQPAPGAEDDALAAFGDEPGTEVTVYPRGHGSRQAVHPYLLWWAVLYAMSQYVRYEPTRWAQIIDVDSSEEAVAVEHLCDRALDLLPELIYRSIARSGTESAVSTDGRQASP